MSLQPILIAGELSGLTNNVKPWLVPDKAFSRLYNAYIFRDRVLKRECLRLIGRLQRVFTAFNYFLTGASPWSFNIKSVSGYVSTADNANPGQVTTKYAHGLSTGDLVIFSGIVGAVGYNNVTFTITVVDTTNFTVGVNAAAFGAYISGGFFISNRSLVVSEPNAEITPGSFAFTIGAITFTDVGDGTITSNTVGNSGTINYLTGALIMTHTAGVGVATTLAYSYYPSLPVMEISQREVNYVDNEDSIDFDTKYAYKWSSTQFVEYIPGTIWDGTNYNGYWTSNFSAGSVTTTARYFFVTNFVATNANPMRYTSDGVTWNTFAPALSATHNLYQALIVIPYYGRLIALNTREGTTDIAGSTNFYNRCRFAKIGDPLAVNAWRTDIPGNGGFIDAPTNEAIMSCAYNKNTLIVFFENSTWELRYNGEYGLPFIWERVSSDFGSVSTFSAITFDDGVMAIGDKGIIKSTDLRTNRIDGDIPDQIFDFQNINNGPQRIQGVRDFQRELALWSFCDSINNNGQQTFPNRVLVYNYRNNTWAIFRDNVTTFGTFQTLTGSEAVTWDSTDILWDDFDVTWDDVHSQFNFPFVASGNQQGFVHYYGYDTTPDEGSLSITGIALVSNTVRLTVKNHNLESGDIIFLEGLMFVDSGTLAPVATTLNRRIFSVLEVTTSADEVDPDVIILTEWSTMINPHNYITNFTYTPDLSTVTYIGGGTVALFPRMDIITKDFNPFQEQSKQMKLSSIDFMVDASNTAAITVNLYANAQTVIAGNLPLGNKEVETYIPSVNLYTPAFPSEYLWHRFYATLFGQFIRIQMTYDNDLMNQINTHTESFELNGIKLNVRPGGHLVF